MEITPIVYWDKQRTLENKRRIDAMVKSGLRKCKGHPNFRPLIDKSMEVEDLLYEEQCGICGGYKE